MDLIFPLLVVVVIVVNVDGVVDGGEVGVSALFSSGLTLSVVDETSLLGGDGEVVVVLVMVSVFALVSVGGKDGVGLLTASGALYVSDSCDAISKVFLAYTGPRGGERVGCVCVMMMMLISQLSIALKKNRVGKFKACLQKGTKKGRWWEGRRNREAARQTKVGGREGGRGGGGLKGRS